VNAGEYPRMDQSQDDRVRRAVFEGVRARPRRHRRILRFGPLPLVAAGLVLGAVFGATAWVTLAPRSVVEHRAECYERADTGSRKSVMHDPDTAGDIALAECRALWSAGAIGAPASGKAPFAVPPLELCLTAGQTFAVFPNRSGAAETKKSPAASQTENERFCDALGLLPGPKTSSD
jgi:hypothetical protein